LIVFPLKTKPFRTKLGRTQAAGVAATIVGGDKGGLGAWVYLSRVRRGRRRRRRPKLVPYEWAPARRRQREDMKLSGLSSGRRRLLSFYII